MYNFCIDVNYDNLFFLLKDNQKLDRLKNIDKIVEGQDFNNSVNGPIGNNYLC